MSVEEKVIAIFEEQLGFPKGEVLLTSTKESLGMDSLDEVETIMALEEEFDIEINDYQAEKFTSVQYVVDFIKVEQLYNTAYNAAKEVMRKEYKGKSIDDVVSNKPYNPVKTISREKYLRCVGSSTSHSLFRSNRADGCLWMHFSACGKYYYWCEYNSKNSVIYFRGEVDWVESNYDDYELCDQVSKEEVIVSFDSDGVVDKGNRPLNTDNPSETPVTEWTDKHYDFNYTLTESDIEKGVIKIDPYFVNRMWRINSWDGTGAAFHCIKNFARISNGKNPLERDLRSQYKQIKRLCELHGVDLDE